MHRLAFVCLVLAAALLLPASNASAATRICHVTYLGSHDRQRLQAAMQATLPDNVSAKGVPSISDCRGYIHALLDTVPQLRPDGVTESWIVSCDREARKWTCDSPDHRQLIWVFANVGGVFRRLEVTFEDRISLRRARTVSVQAIGILLDPASLPVSGCGDTPGPEARGAWEKARQDFPIKQADTVIKLALNIWETRTSTVNVRVNGKDGVTLMFMDDSTASPPNRPCWQQWITVTAR